MHALIERKISGFPPKADMRTATLSMLRLATVTRFKPPKPEAGIVRHKLSDDEWITIRPMLPNKARGVPRVDDRRVLNGIFWVLRSGAPWRDLRAASVHTPTATTGSNLGSSGFGLTEAALGNKLSDNFAKAKSAGQSMNGRREYIDGENRQQLEH
jgi:hypothetical protein